MQAGFLLLEAGKVRSKNSINVAQKNSVDFFLTGIAFTTIGIMVMYGVSSPVFQQVTDPPFTLEITHLEFLYQLGFCGAAVTYPNELK